MSEKSYDEVDQLKVEHEHLKSPKRYRFVHPRCCATCGFHVMAGGTVECLRPNGPTFDAGDMDQWFWVCDYWVKE